MSTRKAKTPGRVVASARKSKQAEKKAEEDQEEEQIHAISSLSSGDGELEDAGEEEKKEFTRRSSSGEEEDEEGVDSDSDSDDDESLTELAAKASQNFFQSLQASASAGLFSSSHQHSFPSSSIPSSSSSSFLQQQTAGRGSMLKKYNGIVQLTSADPDATYVQSVRDDKLARSSNALIIANTSSSSSSSSVQETDLLKSLGNKLLAPSLNRKEAAREKLQLQPKKSTAGSKWFDLPETPLTAELKQDFRLIKMRGYLDPKRFYKKEKGHTFPKFFHVGRVIEGPTEFFSSRMTNKQRKGTMVEEVLNDKKTKTYLKRKFSEVQAAAPKKKYFKSARKNAKR